jgi:hypothetical protein
MVAAMRWENLFDDLEDQLTTERALADRDAFRDHLRQKNATRGLLTLFCEEQLLVGNAVPIEVWMSGVSLWITVDNFGRDWIAGQISEPRALAGYAIVNAACVEQFVFPPQQKAAPRTPNETAARDSSARPKRLERITLRILLRDLSRRRKSGWASVGGRAIHGTIDQVGADFVELAIHQPGRARRTESLESRAFLPLGHLAMFTLDD